MRRPVPAGAAGFTLIEILIVLFIFGVLLTLAVNVARYVYDEAARKETQSTQAIVISAIQAFYDVTDDYPDDGGDPQASGKSLLKELNGEDISNRFDSDLEKRIVKATRDILLKLPLDAFKVGDEAIRDSFGRKMRYDKAGGLGGVPALISAGPDGDFDTAEDNIRSDGR